MANRTWKLVELPLGCKSIVWVPFLIIKLIPEHLVNLSLLLTRYEIPIYQFSCKTSLPYTASFAIAAPAGSSSLAAAAAAAAVVAVVKLSNPATHHQRTRLDQKSDQPNSASSSAPGSTHHHLHRPPKTAAASQILPGHTSETSHL
ncbi:hypothetical protein RJ639_043071, partial [Escallonia herrerae]